jgi:hypothetical protein
MLDRMVRCDNPKCKSVGEPEWLPPKGSRKKAYTAPYGWIQAVVHWVGSGPSLEVDACGLICLQPAVEAKVDEWRHKEEYGDGC